MPAEEEEEEEAIRRPTTHRGCCNLLPPSTPPPSGREGFSARRPKGSRLRVAPSALIGRAWVALRRVVGGACLPAGQVRAGGRRRCCCCRTARRWRAPPFLLGHSLLAARCWLAAGPAGPSTTPPSPPWAPARGASPSAPMEGTYVRLSPGRGGPLQPPPGQSRGRRRLRASKGATVRFGGGRLHGDLADQTSSLPPLPARRPLRHFQPLSRGFSQVAFLGVSSGVSGLSRFGRGVCRSQVCTRSGPAGAGGAAPRSSEVSPGANPASQGRPSRFAGPPSKGPSLGGLALPRLV